MKEILFQVIKSKYKGLSGKTRSLILWGAIAFVTVVVGVTAVAGYALWSVGSYVVSEVQRVDTQAGVDRIVGSIEKVQGSIPWASCGQALSNFASPEFLLSTPMSTWWQSIRSACWVRGVQKDSDCIGTDCREPHEHGLGVKEL